jgi:hypothetical protein
MEQVLPRDMVTVILNYLPNFDLFQYGLTSKTSLHSSEIIWKNRYQTLKNQFNPSCKEDNDVSRPWYSKYSTYFKNTFASMLSPICSKVHQTKDRMEKKNAIIDCFQFVQENYKIMLVHRRFVTFFDEAVKTKLCNFLYEGNHYEKEIAHRFMPFFLPDLYQTYLLNQYFEEDNQEHPDHLEVISLYSEDDRYFEEDNQEQQDDLEVISLSEEDVQI